MFCSSGEELLTIAEIEKIMNKIEPINQRREVLQSSFAPIAKAIAPAAKAVAPRMKSFGVLTGSVTEPQITTTVVKKAPIEINRVRLFSLLKVNMRAILLKKSRNPAPSVEGTGVRF